MNCKTNTIFKYKAKVFSLKKTISVMAVIALLIFLSISQILAQSDNVGIGTTTPNASALLDLVSTNKGFLAPRMTQAQRIAISSPAAGLIVFQTDNTPGYFYFDGSSWLRFVSNTATIPFNLISSGTNTTAAMLVGTGASLAPIGTGYIQSNRFVGSGSTSDAVDLATAEIAGILPVANGGTGLSSVATDGQLLIGNGTGYTLSTLTAGTGISISNSAGGIEISANPGGIDHGSLSGLSDDDHTQYALLAGRGAGQTLSGGTAANGNLTLSTTSHTTKGNYILADLTSNGVLKTSSGNGTLTVGSVVLTSEVSGILPVANGGTGVSTITGMLKGNGTSSFTGVTNTAGNVTFWSDANTISGSSDFTWDDNGKILSLSSGTINVDGINIDKHFKLTAGANTGYVLTSDASGNASWKQANASGWQLEGNILTGTGILGTKSGHDISVITNDIERMKVLSSGGVEITNSLTVGNSLSVSAGGADITGKTDITGDVDITGKAVVTGSISAGSSSTISGNLNITSNNELRLYHNDNYTGFKAPSTLANDFMFSLPEDYGTNGQFLTTLGDGSLSWTTPQSSTVSLPSGTSGQTMRHDGTGWAASDFLTNDGSVVAINNANPSGNVVLDVGGNAKFSGYLSADGSSTINNDFYVTNDLNVDGVARFGTASSTVSVLINGDLEVTGHIDPISLTLQPQTNAPSGNTKGKMYYDNTEGLKVNDGSKWNSIPIAATSKTYSRVRAYLSSDTSISKNTWTKIPFNVENFDSGNEFDNSSNYRFTAVSSGYYQVNARTEITTMYQSSKSYVTIAIYKNGSMYSQGNINQIYSIVDEIKIDTRDNNAPNVSDIVFLSAGQYIEIWSYYCANGGNNATLEGDADGSKTYFSIHKLSDE